MVSHQINNDLALVKMMQCGNEHAFAQLFQIYYEPLRKKAEMILGNEMDAEDLVQVFFMEIWHKKILLNIHASVDAYFQKAIRNRCLNIIHQRKKAKLRYFAYSEMLKCSSDKDLFLNIVPENSVKAFFQHLPKRRKEVLLWVYFENKRYKEVAALMGISVNTVKSHLKLSIKALRIILQENGIKTDNNSPFM